MYIFRELFCLCVFLLFCRVLAWIMCPVFHMGGFYDRSVVIVGHHLYCLGHRQVEMASFSCLDSRLFSHRFLLWSACCGNCQNDWHGVRRYSRLDWAGDCPRYDYWSGAGENGGGAGDGGNGGAVYRAEVSDAGDEYCRRDCFYSGFL